MLEAVIPEMIAFQVEKGNWGHLRDFLRKTPFFIIRNSQTILLQSTSELQSVVIKQ